MSTCKGCRYWSEMIAASDGGGLVKALCLDDQARGMTHHGCIEWTAGMAIDDPARDADEDSGFGALR